MSARRVSMAVMYVRIHVSARRVLMAVLVGADPTCPPVAWTTCGTPSENHAVVQDYDYERIYPRCKDEGLGAVSGSFVAKELLRTRYP